MTWYLGRTYCCIIKDMRICDKTKNYSSMLGLIEELQICGNRMEAALSDMKQHKAAMEQRKELKREIKELEKKVGKARQAKR